MGLSLSAVQASAPLVLVLDREGRVLVWNRACSELTGFAFEEVQGKQAWKVLMPAEAVAEAREGFMAVLRGDQPPRFEQYLQTKSGQVRWVSWSMDITRNPDGHVEFVTALGADVTETKRKEEALRQSEAKERFLSEVGAVLATSLDREETLQKVTELTVEFLADFCAIDLLEEGGALRRWKVAHRDPHKRELAQALERWQIDPKRSFISARALESRKPTLVSRVTAQDLDRLAQDATHRELLGKLQIVSLMCVPLLAHGRLLGAMCFIRSHGAAPYQPDDLRLAEDLAYRAANAIDSAQLYAAAQRAIRARDEVLSIVAHDLRSPLNVSMLAARSLLRDNAPLHDPAWVRRTATAIEKAIQRGSRLIADLLDVARIESGKLSVDRAQVDAEDVLGDAATLFGPLATEAGISLGVEVDDGVPPLWADKERLLQVLSNLVGNALKFTPRGGTVVLSAHSQGQAVEVRVRDTGPGIKPDDLPHLFDRFWQVRSTDGRGTGLGLPIARGIVDAHGGEIWVNSLPGKGSTFCFTIPAAERPERGYGGSIDLGGTA